MVHIATFSQLENAILVFFFWLLSEDLQNLQYSPPPLKDGVFSLAGSGRTLVRCHHVKIPLQDFLYFKIFLKYSYCRVKSLSGIFKFAEPSSEQIGKKRRPWGGRILYAFFPFKFGEKNV